MAGSTFKTNPFRLSKLLHDCDLGVMQTTNVHFKNNRQ